MRHQFEKLLDIRLKTKIGGVGRHAVSMGWRREAGAVRIEDENGRPWGRVRA
jgi:hypothetical protein